jgi:aminoglycoside/choline kinase family phosphotransferase
LKTEALEASDSEDGNGVHGTRWNRFVNGMPDAALTSGQSLWSNIPLQARHSTVSTRSVKPFLTPDFPDMPPPDLRLTAMLDWLRTDLGRPVESLEPASSDASFRRYFRAFENGRSYIVMDAPPPQENVRPFLAVAELMRGAGVQTPEVHAADAENGFVLLGDFGIRSYLDSLDADSADRLYGDALAALLRLQTGVNAATAALPAYDEALLRRELEIFREWFLGRLLGLEPSLAESALLDVAWQRLIESALEQPKVCVHRDYHSRNLMVTDEANPGVLDFQDAVVGPIAYDAVSLLRDCYIAWPTARVHAWLNTYRDALQDAGLLDAAGAERFRRWFDLMGMQRHLKAIGIFSRLKLRDGKPGYLKDIPRTFGYVVEVGRNYPEFAGFTDFLETHIRPRLEEALSP